MTVQELIDQLQNVADKSRQVKIGLDLELYDYDCSHFPWVDSEVKHISDTVNGPLYIEAETASIRYV